MPIDFTKPVKTDNYDTGMLASIRAHVVALACMLEPTAAGTLTSTPTGARRFNNGNGLFEFYNGTAWGEQSTAYLKSATASSTYAPLTGAGTSGTWSINVTGNAATATVLQTSRTINGVSFNGSANITVADATKLPLAGGTMTGTLDLTRPGSDVILQFRAGAGLQALAEFAGNGQGISTTSLAVGQDGSGDAAVYQRANRKLYFATNNVERMTITAGGAVSIGGGYTFTTGDLGVARTASPTTGIIYFTSTAGPYLYYDGAKFIFNSGSVQATDFTATSDARLKTNIEQITGALDRVQQVRGVTFERIDEPGRRQTGVLAQELQAVLPEAVSTFVKDGAQGGTDEYLTVNHGAVIGLLIEAIKELRAEVAELRAAQ